MLRSPGPEIPALSDTWSLKKIPLWDRAFPYVPYRPLQGVSPLSPRSLQPNSLLMFISLSYYLLPSRPVPIALKKLPRSVQNMAQSAQIVLDFYKSASNLEIVHESCSQLCFFLLFPNGCLCIFLVLSNFKFKNNQNWLFPQFWQLKDHSSCISMPTVSQSGDKVE